MEPFILFCVALVVYCGYLTIIDLFRRPRPVPEPWAAERRWVRTPMRQSRVRLPVWPGRDRAGAAA